MAILIYLVILSATLIFYLYHKTFNFWKNLGVTQFPITAKRGNLEGVGKDFHISQFLINYYKKTKELGLKFSGLYFTIQPVLLITDLDLVRTILVKDFNTFPNHGMYYNEKDEPISAHLFNIENDDWRNLRHKISPVFTSGKLKMMFGTISDVADKLLSVIEKQMESTGQLEVKDTLGRFTTDVIGTTAFGLECNSLEDKNAKFYEMGSRIFSTRRSPIGRFIRAMFPNISRFFHLKGLPEEISDFYMKVTKDTVEYREKNPNINRQDFIKLLVDLKKENSVTIEQIAAQSFIFFLAGYETSSSTMTYCMYELSVNEDIQEKAREDVRKAIERNDGKLTYDAIGDMDYLEKCVSETLRKYPVGSALQRVALQDYKIPDTEVTIPKGVPVTIPVHAIHWDEEIYPVPEMFDPERFSHEEIAKRHPYAYIPFGEGPRICIGMRFALVETKLGLAKILMNYKFKIDRSKTTVPLKISPSSFVLAPLEKIYLDIEKVQI